MTALRHCSTPILAATLLLAIAVPASAADAQRDVLLATKLAQSYVVQDPTGDGIADVAVVDFLTDTLWVLAGDGRGGFARADTLQVGEGPRAVVAADFSGDGWPDLAVASFFSGEVTILAGTGGGGFGKPVVAALERGLSSLVAGDFNGDGTADVVAANYLTGELVLLAGTGSGPLLEPVSVGQVAGPTRIVKGAPGANGRSALIVIDASGGRAWQLEADANGGFLAPVPAGPDVVAAGEEAGAAAANDPFGRRTWRIRAVSGHGSAAIAESADPFAFVVEALDEAGTPVAEREVIFTRLLTPDGAGAGQTAATDADGQARIEPALSKLPENVFYVVAGEEADATVLAAASALPPEKLVALIAQSLPVQLASTAAVQDLLDRLQWHLNQGDDVKAVTALVELIDLQRADAGEEGAAARRAINQLLLFGSPAADCVELTCDVPVNGAIESVTETDFLCLTVADGDTLQVAVTETSGSYFEPEWRLLTAAGAPATVCGTWRGAGEYECGPLPAGGGPYRMQVADGGRNATGTYQVHVYSLAAATACEAIPLTCDTPVNGAIENVTDLDLYRFSVADGDTIEIAVAELSGYYFEPQWRLLTPAGLPAPVCGEWRGVGVTECGPLAAVGNPYRIQVRDGGRNATGTYQINITSLVMGCAPPDLVVTAVTDPPAVAVLKQAFRVTDTTKNQGAGAAPASRTRYYLSLDTAKSSSDKRMGAGRAVPALPAGTSSSGSKNVVVPPATKLGLYFLLACADDTQVVDEGGALEANNCRASATKVEVRAPDLVESAITEPPPAVSRGGSFAVVETVRNLGNADATVISTTRFYLSLDVKKSASDLLLTGTRAVPPLPVGGALAGTTTVGVPGTVTPNSYFLLACADDLKKVAEANPALTGEKNNCLASTTKVTVGP